MENPKEQTYQNYVEERRNRLMRDVCLGKRLDGEVQAIVLSDYFRAIRLGNPEFDASEIKQYGLENGLTDNDFRMAEKSVTPRGYDDSLRRSKAYEDRIRQIRLGRNNQ